MPLEIFADSEVEGNWLCQDRETIYRAPIDDLEEVNRHRIAFGCSDGKRYPSVLTRPHAFKRNRIPGPKGLFPPTDNGDSRIAKFSQDILRRVITQLEISSKGSGVVNEGVINAPVVTQHVVDV